MSVHLSTLEAAVSVLNKEILDKQADLVKLMEFREDLRECSKRLDYCDHDTSGTHCVLHNVKCYCASGLMCPLHDTQRHKLCVEYGAVHVRKGHQV